MSIRAAMVLRLLVIGGLSWPPTCAFAQTSGGSAAWHCGGDDSYR